MKKLLFLAAAFVTGITAMAQQKVEDVAKFNAERHDFGKIKHNVPVTTFFTITNTSDRPIVIESATAGCGCTTPEYSKEPIPAGGSTKLKVGYNSAAMGRFDKAVTVKLAGVAEPKIIMIGGEVVEETTGATTVSKKETPAEVKPKAKPKPAKKVSK